MDGKSRRYSLSSQLLFGWLAEGRKRLNFLHILQNLVEFIFDKTSDPGPIPVSSLLP